MIDLEAWGNNLRDFRNFRGLSQRELAELVTAELVVGHVPHNRVSEWEQGHRRPTDEQRVAVGRVLHVNPNHLFPYPP